MREFLLSNAPVLIWVMILAEMILFAALLKEYKSKKNLMPLCMALVCIGLVYDAFVIAIGKWLPETLLFPLSQIRFISHGVLVPLNLLIGGYALRWNGMKLKVLYGITILIMTAGFLSGIARKLETSETAGLVRCLSGEDSPAWAETIDKALSYGTVFPLIFFGIAVWIKQKTPCIFLSGLLMFVFAALGPATGNFDLIFFISMFGELFMILFFWLYARKHTEDRT